MKRVSRSLQGESLNLAASTEADAAQWVLALSELRARAAAGGAESEAAILHAAWQRFDKDGSDSLTLEELMPFFEAVNLDLDKKTVRQLLGTDSSDVEISFGQFMLLYSALGDLKEYDALYNTYSSDCGDAAAGSSGSQLATFGRSRSSKVLGSSIGLTMAQFVRFLAEEQVLPVCLGGGCSSALLLSTHAQ